MQFGNNPVYDSIGAADILKYKLTRIEPISPVSLPEGGNETLKNNEKFTEKAEGAIEQARLAAFGLGHSYVGTEHSRCWAYCASAPDSAREYGATAV